MEFHFFVLSRWSRRLNEQTTERKNKISFLRLFVLCVVQVAQTNKWNFISSFCRVGQGAKTNKRQNAKTRFYFFVCSFCRVVQVAKTKKWNFISSFLSFVAFPKARRNDKTTKLPRNIKVWFVVVNYSFCRLFVLSTSTRQNDNATKWGFAAISFCLLFVLSRYTSRQNKEIKFHFGVCSLCRLP